MELSRRIKMQQSFLTQIRIKSRLHELIHKKQIQYNRSRVQLAHKKERLVFFMYRISTDRLMGTLKYLQPAKSSPCNLTRYI